MGNTTAAKRWVLLAVVAVVASITLSLAVPRLVSSISYLPVKSALARHWRDFPITEAQFPGLIAIANRSIEQHNEARYWQGLGWLHFLHAFSQGAGTSEGVASLQNAQIAFENFVMRSPASPSEWLRLAWIHWLLGGEQGRVVDHLKMSIYTGRAERHLMPSRTELALRVADQFLQDDLSMLRDQLRLTWRIHSRELIRIVRNDLHYRDTLVELLGDDDPKLLTEIEERLEKAS
jgi:hypothetical protein